MSNFMIILGFILYFCYFIAFIFTLAVVMPTAEKNERWAILAFLVMGGFVVGTIFYSIGMAMKEQQPMQLSQSCGTVLGYKYYKNCSGRSQSRCDPFERIQIRLDDSKYSRLMRFDGGLIRKNNNDHVCFRFYDRYKYSHLKGF